MTRPRTRWRRGEQHASAYPIRDSEGRPAWEGIIVIEPHDIRWRCGHAHVVDPDDKGPSYEEAVACAETHEGRVGRIQELGDSGPWDSDEEFEEFLVGLRQFRRGTR